MEYIIKQRESGETWYVEDYIPGDAIHMTENKNEAKLFGKSEAQRIVDKQDDHMTIEAVKDEHELTLLDELKDEKKQIAAEIKKIKGRNIVDVSKLDYLKGVRRGLDIAIKLAK